MGSSQSSISSYDPETTHSSTSSSKLRNDGDNGAAKKTKDKSAKRNSVEYKCRKQKRSWSRCVTEHYEKKFLPGISLEPEDDCDVLFDNFRECYMAGMIKERQKKGMAAPAEGSMLHEFMAEEGLTYGDNDK